MTRRLPRALTVTHILTLTLTLTATLTVSLSTGCASDAPAPSALNADAASPSSAPADDPAARLAALFALVDSHHRGADVAAARQDLPAAAAAMRALIADLEAATLDHPDRLLFLIDAHTRLARLQAQLNQPADALATLEAGLRWHRLTPRPTLFGGYLLQTKGDLLLEQGDDRGAVQAHKEAILVFKAIIDTAPP